MSDVLEANLPTGYTAAKISYPNCPFTTPNGGSWIRCTWTNLGDVSRDAVGCYVITEGICSIDFFTEKVDGDLAILKNAEEVKNVFVTHMFNDVTVNGALVRPMPEEESWYFVRVDVEYQYEGYVNADNS
jgi:hypothetical protein